MRLGVKYMYIANLTTLKSHTNLLNCLNISPKLVASWNGLNRNRKCRKKWCLIQKIFGCIYAYSPLKV